MKRIKLLPLLFLLGACSAPTTAPAQTAAPVETAPEITYPATTFTNEFICDNLRAGATVEAVVEWERSEGVALDQAYPNVETAVYEVCPEFEILLEDYKE